MRVLVVGGSGYVGSLVLPVLAARHTIRVFDLRPPPELDCEYVPGDATDRNALAGAAGGVDAVVHAAMGRKNSDPVSAFDVNVKSVHLTLSAAHRTGVPHAVHVSSLSVYRAPQDRRLDDESVRPDATDLYGLTKRLGEQVCQAAAARWRMSVNVLRLAWPTPDEAWPRWAGARPPKLWHTRTGTPIEATAASDVARALLAALEYRNGFQIFTIAGDGSARLWSTAKAQSVLGWAPTFGAGLNDR
jgi:nucleoside-diphosphate-sugar epimerase